jgi:predicted transcriptional regulator
MHPESIKGILRTRGYMTARRSQKRGYGIPVKMYGEGKNFYTCRPQNLVHGAKIGK